jgi:hypothetical protein
MWVWDTGAPQLAIGMPRTGILTHVRITYLSYTTAFPLCCFVHIRSRSTWLRDVKHVPCHVLETRMPHVMDDRIVSRGLCWGVTRKIRMTTLTRERVLITFKYKARAQRDCHSLCK